MGRSARLAGEDVRGHVVVLGDTVDDGYDVLLPFIIEGLEQGDRAFHIVDPALRDAHLERLGEAGIDVAKATASNQLEVRTWNEAYLRGGTFDPDAQLALIRQVLAEGPGLGYPITRVIGSVEWAVDSPDVLPDLLAYERAVGDLVRDRPDVLVCTYDLSRHSARLIADVLGVHTVAVVGGVVRTSGPPQRASARDRLLTAASKLFQEMGIQAAGVDAIIQAAGVAKATFYRHFPSKDDLVVAWLRDPRTRWFEGVMSRARGAGSAHQVVGRFFEEFATWLEAEGYRGCPYLNTSVEITDPAHPALPVITDYLQEIEDSLADLLAAAGYRDSRGLAGQLQTLIAGSISLAVARRSGASAVSARDAALAILAEADQG
jgi:AcrR family transcriptional regulator